MTSHSLKPGHTMPLGDGSIWWTRARTRAVQAPGLDHYGGLDWLPEQV